MTIFFNKSNKMKINIIFTRWSLHKTHKNKNLRAHIYQKNSIR